MGVDFLKRKLIKKLSLFTLIGVLSLSTVIPAISANAATNADNKIVFTSTASSKSSFAFKEAKDAIEKYLVLNGDGTISLSSDIPASYNEKYKLDSLRSHLSKINKKVKSKEIAVDHDFKIKNVNSSSIRTSSGSTYVDEYWWGYSEGFSYSGARTTITKLNYAAEVGASMAVVGGAIGNLFVIVGGSVTGVYCHYMANNIQDVNEDNNKAGIVIDVNWDMDYDVYSQ